MINEGIIERAKESVRKHYNCNGEYPCHNSGDCEMCRGDNTPYDCCGCGAGDYFEGYIAGATEQKQIDIDKAKQAFMTSCGWLKTTQSWFDAVFDEFIKELEKTE